jgi:hypothetical protein
MKCSQETTASLFLLHHSDCITNLKHLVNEILHFGSKKIFVELLITGWIASIHLERIRVAQHIRLDETVMNSGQTGFNITQILMVLNIFTLELDVYLVEKRKYVGKEAIV